MSDSRSGAATDNGDKIKESVNTLKQLYSVVIALALTEAIVALVSRTDAGVNIRSAALPWFLALVLTLIPFHHGAMRHLDEVYIFGKTRFRKPTFLVDYLILFAEAGVFVWLALVLTSPNAFVGGYAVLLGVDVFWALATFWLTNKLHLAWLLTNIVTLLIIGLIHWTPVLDAVEPIYLVVIAVARTVTDYYFSWDFYFLEAEDGAS